MERDYHHPYEPYDIQVQFMAAVYDCLEQSKVGIFESPTGLSDSACLPHNLLSETRHRMSLERPPLMLLAH